MFTKKAVQEPQLASLDPQEKLKYEAKQLKKMTNAAAKWTLVWLIFLIVSQMIFPVIFSLPGSFDLNKTNNGYYGYNSCTLYYLAGISAVIVGLGLAVLLAFKSMRKKTSSTLFPFGKVNFKLGLPLFLIGIAFMSISQIISSSICDFFNIKYPATPYSGAPIDIILMLIRIAVIPAILEELMFRGVILSSLKPCGNTLAIVVSSILFSFMHANFAQIPFALLVGLMLGFIAVKTNSLLISMILHFTNNLWSCVLTIIVEEIGENIATTLVSVTYIIAIALGVIALIYSLKTQKQFFKLNDNEKLIPFKNGITTTLTSPFIIVFFIVAIILAIYN